MGYTLQGMGQYSKTASTDPADIVTFDLSLDDWLSQAVESANIAELAETRGDRVTVRTKQIGTVTE